MLGGVAEGGVEPIQGLIRQPPQLMQRTGLGDPLLGGDVGEQGKGPILHAAYLLNASKPFSRDWLGFSSAS